MFIRRLDAPAEVVSLALLKQHCRVEHDREDDLLRLYAQAAVEHGQSLTSKVWGETTFEASGFAVDRGGVLVLPRSPVTEIESVVYADAVGQGKEFADYGFTPSTLLPNSNPLISIGAREPWDAVISSDSWPDNPVVRFKAGWPHAEMPTEFIQWVLVKVAGKYAQREDIAGKQVSTFPPDFVDNLLNPYRRMARM